ncbi:cell division protein FtsA [Candidatus Roizmanbacteria bacterium CG02_land_8_20_14_3_00_36_15]|nr:MAG: cell division protein FtsA [Candidatus Roizmanbacteria bacterium CG02_land_8_20_14_3_00_36_15]PIY70007.1 MAG: cell division protein FtsA [Candidatus Roizmanbacteria bacterium CG_4_10_14_0_8_um_filter_36_36]
MTSPLLCAIDIGSSKIATICAVESKDGDELQVIGYNLIPSKGVRKGLIVDIDEATIVLEESIEKAERMSGHKINHAFVSVGGPHISSFNSHGIVAVANPQGEINEDDVMRAIEAARAISISNTREIIEVLPRDYIVDGQPGIKNPVGMSGVRLEVDTHIITASQTNIKNINRSLNDLGIENHGFIFSGLASAEAVLTETEKELGVVLVDIGGGKTDLCIYVEGSLAFSGSLAVGAKNITNDIAVGLRISLDSAEKVKLFLTKEAGKIKKKSEEINFSQLNLAENLSSISYKTLVEGIMSPRLEEIYKLIFEEIEKSGFGHNVPSGLVITGGGAQTVGMVDIGKKVLGLPIRIGVPENITGLTDEILSPPFASTVGLILYGKKNTITEKSNFKNFNRILKDFSFDSSFSKVKNFFKQFIP